MVRYWPFVWRRRPFWRRWFGASKTAPALRLPPRPGADFAEVYRWDGGDLEPVTFQSAGDVAAPNWVFRTSTIVPDADEADGPHGTVALTRRGVDHLLRIDGDDQTEWPTPYTAWSSLAPAPEGFVGG